MEEERGDIPEKKDLRGLGKEELKREIQKAKLKRELREMVQKKKGGAPRHRHNVNFYLLLLIVVLLVALVAATFYFLWKYESIAGEKDDFAGMKNTLENQLAQCSSNLDRAAEQVEAMAADLNISAASRESLNMLYLNLSNVKSRLESELTNMEASLASCRLELQEASDELAEAINELNEYIAQYNKKVAELQTALGKIAGLEDELDECEDLNIALASQLHQLEECVEENNCTACI